MALSPETEQWLKDLKSEGGLDDATLATIRTAAEGKADSFIKGSVLRQSDYSRNMATHQAQKAEVDAAKERYEAELAKSTQFQTELATWQRDAKGSFEQALAAREKAENEKNLALARLQTVASKWGVPMEDIAIEGLPITPPTQNPGETTVKQEDIDKMIAARINAGTQQAAQVDALLQDISDKYQDLYGKRWAPGTASQILAEAQAAGKSLAGYAAEKFEFGKKEKEQSDASFEARVKERADAEVARQLSAAGLPGANPGFRDDLQAMRSPVLREGGIPAPPQESGQGLSAAIAAFQQGKYKATR